MSSLEKYEIGDVVQLKSGGPNMTVVEGNWISPNPHTTPSDLKVTCSWFDESYRLQTHTFSALTLERYTEGK